MKQNEKIDTHLVLRAVARILDKGKQVGSETRYRGVTVVSDYDGYNIKVSTQDVTITVMFHNTLNIEHRSAVALDECYDRLKAIAREKD